MKIIKKNPLGFMLIVLMVFLVAILCHVVLELVTNWVI